MQLGLYCKKAWFLMQYFRLLALDTVQHDQCANLWPLLMTLKRLLEVLHPGTVTLGNSIRQGPSPLAGFSLLLISLHAEHSQVPLVKPLYV
jgi:hypothetical protein